MVDSKRIIRLVLAFLLGILVSEIFFSFLFGDGVFFGRRMQFVSLGLIVLGVVLRSRVGLLMVFVAGILYFNGSFLSGDDMSGVKFYVGDEVLWKVRIVAEVDVRRSGQKLIVEVEDCVEGGCFDGLKGRAMLNVSKYPRYFYGDKLEVKGLLEEPFETEDFSYKKYLERYGVYGVVKNPRVRVVGNEVSNPFFGVIFWLKEGVQERINKLWAEPYASFESGLLLGARKGIPDYLIEAFNITGLTHIIAISGYNISLVIVLVGVAFARFSRRWKVVLSVGFVIGFTVLVGMSAAVVRAAIMGSIGLVALFFGRSTKVTLTLLMSALLMNLWNPKILPYDVGFQLSFVATCGIIYVAPKIDKWFSWSIEFLGCRLCIPEKMGIREALQMTIAAQITTLPVILFHFGRLSIVSPMANVLVAPFIPLSMGSGAIAFVLDFLSGWLGVMFEWFSMIFVGITWIFLEIIIQLTLFCSKIPLASVEVGDFDIFLVCLSYFFVWEVFKD